MKTLPLLGIALLAGCTLAPESREPEAIYQGLAALDGATTLNTAHRPDCYYEAGPAKAFIGEHPSAGRVVGYFAIAGLAHYQVTRFLDSEVDATDSDAWRYTRLVWDFAGIGLEGYSVIHNYRAGLRPFGHGAASDCTGYR